MVALQLRLLGGLEVQLVPGAPLEIPTRKIQGLLVYLALNADRALPREKLAAFLWGDSGEKQAHGSLRQALSVLRKALAAIEPPMLQVDRTAVVLDSASLEVDVLAFRALAASTEPADLEAAVALYRGDLLDGVSIPEPEFEDWLETERRHLRALMGRVLSTLIEHKRAAGELLTAVELAQRLLAVDPLQESVHRTLMTLYGELGQRQTALQQYQQCRDLLQRNLSITPDAETEALMQALRNGQARGESAGEGAAAASDEVLQAVFPPPPAESDDARAPRSGRSRRPSWLLPAAIGVAVVVAGVLAWTRPWAPDLLPVPSEEMALPLPDRPSIAIMAFDNLSGDENQDYLGEALSESIITELSRFPELFVIARNSSFTYRDQPVKVQRVAKELGVRYVLEGSVQRSGGQIRVSTQLIDALKGNHLWAERYDREAEDLFLIQDDITATIVATVQGKVLHTERKASGGERQANLTALEHIWEGDKYLLQWTDESVQKARALYEKALAADPNLARAYNALAHVNIAGHRNGWTDLSRDAALDQAFEMARKAVELAPYDYYTHFILGAVYTEAGDQDRALVEYGRALELNPNAADVLAKAADSLHYQGRFEEAVGQLLAAMRLNPHYPDWWNWNLAWGYYYLEDYGNARTTILQQTPFPNLARRMLSAIYLRMGQPEKAQATIAEFLENEPGYTLVDFRLNLQDKYTNPAHMDRILEDVRRAGLPER